MINNEEHVQMRRGINEFLPFISRCDNDVKYICKQLID